MSVQLKEAVNKIIPNVEHGALHMEAYLVDPTQLINVRLNMIEELVLQQNFEDNYSDIYLMTFKVRVQEYQLIVNNYSDLKVSIVIRKKNLLSGEINPEEPITREYKIALASDTIDIEKKMSAGALQPSETNGWQTEDQAALLLPITLQLIEPELFDIRKIGINDILTNVTIEDVIKHTIALFGIQKYSMVKPDNQRVYRNFIIPPIKYFADLFNYLQEHYGIYSKGCGYYYTGGVCYIYPKYERDLDAKRKTLHVYKVPEHTYGGLNGYSEYRDPKTIHSITPHPVTLRKITESSVENRGVAFAYLPGDDYIDGMEHDSSKTTIRDDNARVENFEVSGRAQEKSYRLEYKGVSFNPYKYTEDYARDDTEMASITIDYAMPFMIQPGHRVIFHYDAKSQYKTQRGIVLAASYRYVSTLHSNRDRVLLGAAQLAISLDPNDYTKD